MFALCTAVTLERWLLTAYSKAYFAIRSLASSVMSFMLCTTPSTICHASLMNKILTYNTAIWPRVQSEYSCYHMQVEDCRIKLPFQTHLLMIYNITTCIESFTRRSSFRFRNKVNVQDTAGEAGVSHHMFDPAVFPLGVLSYGNQVHIRIWGLVALNRHTGAYVCVQIKCFSQEKVHRRMASCNWRLQRTCRQNVVTQYMLLTQTSPNIDSFDTSCVKHRNKVTFIKQYEGKFPY